MKPKHILFLLAAAIITGCSEKDDNFSEVNFKFIHKWDESIVTSSDLDTIQFINESGNELSIERLRYIISNIEINDINGESYLLNNYNLLNLEDESSLNFGSNQTLKTGTYSNISFIFGLTNDLNIDGAYPDLNSAIWNVPLMLGGGYHYMQLDGKYISNSGEESGYNYHSIRAIDNPGPNPIFPEDTYFKVDLGPVNIGEDCKITISMNIANWFKDPYSWDLNDLNQMLMANSYAQILMKQNGQNVFNLESIE